MWLSISIAARICGVCTKTLRRWESQGRIIPSRTQGGHRRYLKDTLIEFLKTGEYRTKHNLPTGIAAVYGRVSASKQKNDLQTQISALCEQANSDGFTPKI